MPQIIQDQAVHDRAPTLLGALLGWKRFPLPRGNIVRLEVARRADDARAGEFDQYDIGLSANQLRTLGEDLIRAADELDGHPREPRRSWWSL